MKKEKLVKNLNIFLKDTKFLFFICGSFQRPVNELEPNEEKYIEILDRNDEECCYMDWEYEEFNEFELKKYAENIPIEQGNIEIHGDDEATNDYLKLGELIIKYFKTN